ncbi:MAG: bifunctional serine/threonine-protein kinase/formylglycine-generating enzyme family protein [Planctomycetota bacterium]
MSDAEEQLDGQAGDAESPPTEDLPPQVLRPGTQVGQFRIEQELGHGGAGVVYLARDTKLDRRVAIKSIPLGHLGDPTWRARFQREAKLLASLNHPNIATIHEELEETKGQTYLVLEYVAGETLGQRIARGPYGLKEALGIALEIAEAMWAAHEKGVIHRDLKPENIKITPEGRTKILDFGIAKMVSAGRPRAATITEPGQVIGTPGYMSPEQARAAPTDHRTDIWSFGCLLYEMLTNKCAFPGETASEALASVLKTNPDWQALPREAAPDVRHIIETCLQKAPEQRYQSALELYQALRKCQVALAGPAPKALDLKALFLLLRKPRIAAGTALIMLLLVAVIAQLISRSLKTRWARLEALPQIKRLIEQEEYRQAYVLAQQAEQFIPTDPVLRDLWPQVCRDLSIRTEPAGAGVYYRDYADFEGEREYLGTSPLEKIRHPLGIFRWEIEKEGHETRVCAAAVYPTTEDPLTILLEPEDRNPGMLPIPVPDGEPFWIGKYEVTNAQFQKFVDANGYGRKEFWTHTFVEDGNELSWTEAKKRFVDRTGNPGPATWEWGTYPEGQGDYPVSGVSWYEAAAFARWAGKDLPVVKAWEWAANPEMRSTVVPYSNIGPTEGPAPVGSYKGMGRFGLYDAAGNVKEWCWNATDDAGSQRYICGGAWADPIYAFIQRNPQPPMSRDVTIGFRCARYVGGLKSPSADPIAWFPAKDYDSVPAISDELLASCRETIYGYAPREMDDSVVMVDDNPRHWRKEKVEFDAPYGGERIPAYLFLPKGVDPPYQPVVYFPGSGALDAPSSETLVDFGPIDFVIKSGRAVLYPIYKGTYERAYAEEPEPLEWNQCFARDLRRSVDYLEKRARTQGDIDMDKLTFYGLSLGTYFAPILLAVEDRIQSAVLLAGGFLPFEYDQLVDPARFAPHVKIPILMVNGVHDGYFPVETSAKPMLERFGTPRSDKDLEVYDGGHSMLGLFYWQIQKDVISWLDTYPVTPAEQDGYEQGAQRQ